MSQHKFMVDWARSFKAQHEKRVEGAARNVSMILTQLDVEMYDLSLSIIADAEADGMTA